MQKNVASQKLIVYAFDSTTSLPKTGDAANLTAYVSKDYGTVTVLGDTSATEMDATNAKGYYLFDLTQAETNADTLLFSCKSATANIVVVGAPATVFTTAPNFSNTSIDSNGRLDIIKVAGTTQTARDIGGAVPTVAAGASGGLLISGTNSGTTTLGALTVSGTTTLAAISGTTLTLSGAVAFQSTFAVTTSTSFGALSCTTLTASGAVALQSTLGITGAVTLSSTLGVGATTLNALTVTNNLLVSGTSTLTGAVSLGSTLGVTGTTTLAALNTGAIGTGNVTITGTLSTSGTVTFNAFTISNAFIVSGATTLTGILTATNAGNSIVGVSAVTLSSTGLDSVLVESGIVASAALTNDAGTQLTSINARQALALSISPLAGLLSGAGTTSVAIKPGGNSAGNTRVAATVDASGNRTASNIKVPT